MYHLIQFLLAHGYLVLFGFVLAEQIGLPIPAVPILLAMGALTGRGHFGFVEALLLAAAAATLGDLLWYTLGRRRGYAVVKFLCRLSLEPDSCVRRTTDTLRPARIPFSPGSQIHPGIQHCGAAAGRHR